MYKIEFGKSGIMVPTVAVGCMRIKNMSEAEVSAFVNTAIENGANFFDHADIYGGGKSESVFGKAIASISREDIIIQTKCGIRQGQFDFSYDHIVNSVEGSLSRLGTDYIDVLLLHRPDALMEPEEVARAFDYLKSSGKVHHFGVSNQNPYQMQLLQNCLDMPLCANQLQFGIMHAPMIHSGINVNMYNTPQLTVTVEYLISADSTKSQFNLGHRCSTDFLRVALSTMKNSPSLMKHWIRLHRNTEYQKPQSRLRGFYVIPQKCNLLRARQISHVLQIVLRRPK